MDIFQLIIFFSFTMGFLPFIFSSSASFLPLVARSCRILGVMSCRIREDHVIA